jgi:hypothetical protein
MVPSLFSSCRATGTRLPSFGHTSRLLHGAQDGLLDGYSLAHLAARHDNSELMAALIDLDDWLLAQPDYSVGLE